MADTAQQLLHSLADYLKLGELPRTADGAVELPAGEGSVVWLRVEDSHTLVLSCPVMPVPADLDIAAALWLLRLNAYDSPLTPFSVAVETRGRLLLWGRLPVRGLDGLELAGVIDNAAEQAEMIRSELGSEAGAAAPFP